MTDRLYAKYMWLISTINDAGKISFEESHVATHRRWHPIEFPEEE